MRNKSKTNTITSATDRSLSRNADSILQQTDRETWNNLHHKSANLIFRRNRKSWLKTVTTGGRYKDKLLKLQWDLFLTFRKYRNCNSKQQGGINYKRSVQFSNEILTLYCGSAFSTTGPKLKIQTEFRFHGENKTECNCYKHYFVRFP